jgi:ABC-type nitrate/sulfonate/bicarbonate transport system ATPase subunit
MSVTSLVDEPRTITTHGGDIAVDSVTRAFGSGPSPVYALSDVSLDIPEKQFVSIIGPSGCGKSTLFNIIAGLDHPTSGDIRVNGQSIIGEQGNVGYLLQDDLLLPWRSIIDNVILGLEIKGVAKSQCREIARPLMAAYGLGDFADHFPSQLSGGMRQRAAMLRTIMLNQNVLLLDEPFGKLDAQTRVDMQEWLLDLWDEFRKTVVFVTHDIDEAIYLSDRVLVMSPRPGRVVDDITVDLERPRPPEIIDTPEFTSLRHRIRDHLDKAKIDEGSNGSEAQK